jgi:hypothetical protein
VFGLGFRRPLHRRCVCTGDLISVEECCITFYNTSTSSVCVVLHVAVFTV